MMKVNNIPIREYTIAQLKEVCFSNGNGNKKLFGEYIVKKYPELKLVYKRQIGSKNGYYIKMFEAILCVNMI